MAKILKLITVQITEDMHQSEERSIPTYDDNGVRKLDKIVTYASMPGNVKTAYDTFKNYINSQL